MNGVAVRIAELSDEAKSLGEAQYKAVRSGAQADEETISGAISYKVTEFRLDEQSAKDAYDAAIEDLNMKFGKGEISKAEYDAGVQDAQATRDAAVQQAQDAFNQAFAEIIKGIAKSEGNEAALQTVMENMANRTQFSSLMDGLMGELMKETPNPAVVQSFRTQINSMLGELLGDAYDPSDLDYAIKSGDQQILGGFFNELLASDKFDVSALSEVLGGKVGEAWAAALESGALAGTDFDVTTTQEQLAALLGAMDMQPVGADVMAGVGEGMATADLSADALRAEKNIESSLRTALDSHSPSQKMKPIGADVAAGVGQGMADADFSSDAKSMADNAKTSAETALNGSGQNAGRMFSLGIAQGIRAGKSSVISAAIEIARAAVRSIKTELEIQSPSRVTAELGMYTGKGFEVGMVESLNAAIRSAQSVVGSMNLTPRLTAPDLGSAFASAAGSIADAEGSRPIYLNVNGRTLATVTAADTRRAQNSYNRSIALGVGK